MRRPLLWLLAAIGLVVLACSPIRYYSQAVWGGARLLAQREPVAKLLRNPMLGELLAELYMTARKWRTGIYAISQTWKGVAHAAPVAASTT